MSYGFDKLTPIRERITMKKKVKVEEIEGEGFLALLNKRVLLLCAGYFYEGELEGVNDSFVKLRDPSIVYSTGDWEDKNYSDIQKLHANEWYIQTGLIESFGISKND